MENMLEKPLPHSADSEQVILGSVIVNNGLIAEATESLEPEDFYVQAHRRVFVAMQSLFARGSEISPQLIGEELKRDGLLESVGNITSITLLTVGVPRLTNLKPYIARVTNAAQTRALIKASSKITAESLEAEDDADVLIDRAEAEIFAIRDRRSTETIARVNNLADERLEQAQARQTSGKPVSGVPTGYAELDQMTAGLHPGNLIILAGRPSMGKTTLGLNLCSNVASSGYVCGFFSLEMNRHEVTDRILCSMARVDSHSFRQGNLTRDDWGKLSAARRDLEQMKLFVDDTAGLTVMQLRAKARRIAASQKRLDLVVVDYLQLMRSRKAESRLQEVSQVARELKEVAKELNVPLVVMSQLSRQSEQRPDHKPVLSDLRESGEIEQAADVVAFIYRPEYYNRTEENAGIAEIVLSKQRNGRTGNFKLTFLPEFTRFDNMWSESYSR